MSDSDFSQLAIDVGHRLQERGWMLATAESCTGGMIAAAVTAIAGSSAWFDCGFVTYSYAAKTASLDVPKDLIARHGAVSEAVAKAMAEGCLAHSDANAGVSVTGIAGPGGGAPGKPVGTVCFGWATGDRLESTTCRFDGDRASVRRQSALFALERARRLLPRPGAPGLSA